MSYRFYRVFANTPPPGGIDVSEEWLSDRGW